MNPANLVAFAASLGVGCGVLYSNPKRAINRAFFAASLNVAVWLICLGWLRDPLNPDPVTWVRVTSAVGAFIPALLWVIKECAMKGRFDGASARKGWTWFAVAVVMAGLCFSYAFIPAESTRDHPLRGLGWSVFSIVNGSAYAILFFRAIYDLRGCSGIQKIELQTLLFGGAPAGFVGIALTWLGPALGLNMLTRLLPLVIVAFYAFAAWGISSQKVLDARGLFRSALQLIVSISLVSALIAASMAVSPDYLPRSLAVVLCAVMITLAFQQLSSRSLRATLMGGNRDAEFVRRQILESGRDEFERDLLVRRFSAILANWARTEAVSFLFVHKGAYTCRSISLPIMSPAVSVLLDEKWATPESLARQREGVGRNELAAFMKEHGLGVVICSPGDDGLSFMLTLGVRASRVPFTWSDVKLLEGWTAVIESIFSRINFTEQARESEQLRTAGLLGASLAHEIRNPLVTLKTIAQSAKARYNDPEFRRLLIELVPTEIERIEGLVSGLMDLGRPQHPHFESLQLNEVVETSIKLVRPKALDESVMLECKLDEACVPVHGDRSSIRQIILNLVMNAIQAVEVVDGRREVVVRTIAGPSSVVLEIGDNGPGMPQEVRDRLFQPFTTSNKTSGMGLGLAITADLVRLHHGEITLVDGQEVGTTFRVTLPCQQPSS